MSTPEPSQRRRQPTVTAVQRKKFLEGLAAGWSVTHAAEQAGRIRQRFYKLRETDEAFAADWEEAVEAGTDVLEQQALDIALTGAVEEVRNGAGELTSTRRRPDPQMVRYLLTARRPQVYSEKQRVEIQATVAMPAPEDRSASLADVAKILREAGAFDALEQLDIVDGEATDLAELPEGSSE